MLGSGVNFSILSPGLKFWAASFGTDLNGISAIFTWRSAGYVVGCLFGCVLFRYINRQICLSLMYFLISLTLILANVSRSLKASIACLGVQGLCTGVCDAATNVIMCQIWKDKSGPYMQALYFVFAIGCTIAPVFSAPFLDITTFKTPMYMCAGLVFLSSVLLVSLVFLVKDEEDEEAEEEEQVPSVTSVLNLKNVITWTKERENQRTAIVVILTAFIILSYSGMEIVYWEFLAPYLQEVKHLNITPEKASYMTGAVNYAFTIGRGLGIFVVTKVSPLALVYADFVLLFIACGGLLISNSLWMLWLGNILIGIAFATVYPQIYAIVAKEITVTNFYSSIFVFSSGVTSVFYPALVSAEITKNHNFLIWLVLISVAVSAGLLLVMNLLLRKYFRRPLRTLANNPTTSEDCEMCEL